MTRRTYRWELRKLAAQRRTYLGLGAAFLAPLLLVAALRVHRPDAGDPNTSFFVRETLSSGFAVPLVLLLFASIWLFPLVAALVAGDIVAAEDHNRTLKTILTRSTSRTAIFTAKVLATFTYVVCALLVMAVTGTVAGGLSSGFTALPTFTTVISPERALVLVAASTAVYAAPALAVASVGLLLSTVARNSAGAVVGTLMVALGMQLTQIVPGLDSPAVQRWLLTPQLDAWLALFRTPIDRGTVEHAGWISLLYVAVCLTVAWVHFVRRDVLA